LIFNFFPQQSFLIRQEEDLPIFLYCFYFRSDIIFINEKNNIHHKGKKKRNRFFCAVFFDSFFKLRFRVFIREGF